MFSNFNVHLYSTYNFYHSVVLLEYVILPVCSLNRHVLCHGTLCLKPVLNVRLWKHYTLRYTHYLSPPLRPFTSFDARNGATGDEIWFGAIMNGKYSRERWFFYFYRKVQRLQSQSSLKCSLSGVLQKFKFTDVYKYL